MENKYKIRTIICKECGYNILRFWEHEVYKKEEEVIANIKRTISKIA